MIERGHKLDFKTAKDKNVVLTQYGVLSYENVILLAPSANSLVEKWHPLNCLKCKDCQKCGLI